MSLMDNLRERAKEEALKQLDARGSVLDAALETARKEQQVRDELRRLQEPEPAPAAIAPAPDAALLNLLNQIAQQMAGLQEDLTKQQEAHAQETARLRQEMEAMRAAPEAIGDEAEDGDDEDDSDEDYGPVLPLPDAMQIARQGEAIFKMLMHMDSKEIESFGENVRRSISHRYDTPYSTWRGDEAANAMWEYGYGKYLKAQQK